MDARTYVVLSKKINEHTFTFHMPLGVPYGEAYDAAFSILEDILELSKQAVEKAKRSEEEKVSTNNLSKK